MVLGNVQIEPNEALQATAKKRAAPERSNR